MKLYDKKMNTLAELRMELAAKHLEADNYFRNALRPDFTSTEEGDTSSSEMNEWLQAGFDFLLSKGVADKVLALAIPALKLVGSRVEKNLLKSMAKDFVSGYAKWKALELGIKLAFSFLDKKVSEKED